VNRETVGDVAARAVDVDRDRLRAVVGELAKPLDDAARGIFFDITDEVDVAEPVGRFLAEDALDGVDQLPNQAIVQVSKGNNMCDLGPIFLGRGRNRRVRHGQAQCKSSSEARLIIPVFVFRAWQEFEERIETPVERPPELRNCAVDRMESQSGLRSILEVQSSLICSGERAFGHESNAIDQCVARHIRQLY